MIFVPVPTADIAVFWWAVQHLLAKGVRHNCGRYGIEDLHGFLLSGKQLLWIGFDPDTMEIQVAFTTSIMEFPQRRTLFMETAGGKNLLRWSAAALDVLTRWARDNGCSSIWMLGRTGWKRAIERLGAKQTHALFEIEVTHGQFNAAESPGEHRDGLAGVHSPVLHESVERDNSADVS